MDDYNYNDDIWKSVNWAYQYIRERAAKTGQFWIPQRPSQQLSQIENHQILWPNGQSERSDGPSELPSDATTQSN